MSRIQRYPDGLLQLLQLRTSGIPPQVLQGDVRPVIDMLPWYLSGLEASVTGTGIAMAAAGVSGVSLTVPQDEFWVPRVMTMRLVATQVNTVCLVGWRLVRGSVNAYLPGPQVGGFGGVTLSTISAAQEFSWQPPSVLVLRPGDRFEVECSSLVSGAVTATVSGLVSRIGLT